MAKLQKMPSQKHQTPLGAGFGVVERAVLMAPSFCATTLLAVARLFCFQRCQGRSGVFYTYRGDPECRVGLRCMVVFSTYRNRRALCWRPRRSMLRVFYTYRGDPGCRVGLRCMVAFYTYRNRRALCWRPRRSMLQKFYTYRTHPR